MFQNRIHGFIVPNVTTQYVALPATPNAGNTSNLPGNPMQVQIADIYQAARQRAIEEHELDKLFNPEFYDDYQI